MKNEENLSLENESLLKRMNRMMADEKELILLKGKMSQPKKMKTDEDKIYYTFVLRVLKRLSSDEYGTTFNTYFCVVPTNVSCNMTDDDIKSMKDNEVICLLTANCRTKTLTNSKVTVNNITLFVNDIVITRTIDNSINNSKVVNL
jgi:hypothetical protein